MRVGSIVITAATHGDLIFVIFYLIFLLLFFCFVLWIYKRIKNKLKDRKGK